MATDVNDRAKIAGDWKAKTLAGVFLFLVGIVGLVGWLPLGELPVQWTASTVLVLVGLTVMMYGLADIT